MVISCDAKTIALNQHINYLQDSSTLMYGNKTDEFVQSLIAVGSTLCSENRIPYTIGSDNYKVCTQHQLHFEQYSMPDLTAYKAQQDKEFIEWLNSFNGL